MFAKQHDSKQEISSEELHQFLCHRTNATGRLDPERLDALDALSQFESPNYLKSSGIEVFVLPSNSDNHSHYELKICKVGREQEPTTKVFVRCEDGMYVFTGEQPELEISTIVDRCVTCIEELGNTIAMDNACRALFDTISMPDAESVTFEDLDFDFAEKLKAIVDSEPNLLDEEMLRETAFKLMEVLVSPRQSSYLTLFCLAAAGTQQCDGLLMSHEIEVYARDGLENCSVEELRRILLDFDGRTALHQEAHFNSHVEPESRWGVAAQKYYAAEIEHL
jgi:hypothetical protein